METIYGWPSLFQSKFDFANNADTFLKPILFMAVFLTIHLVMCHCVRAKQKSNFMHNGVDMDWFKNSNSEHFSLRT